MTNYRKFCAVTTTTCSCILIESSSFPLSKSQVQICLFSSKKKTHCQKFTLSHIVEGNFTWLIGKRIQTRTKLKMICFGNGSNNLHIMRVFWLFPSLIATKLWGSPFFEIDDTSQSLSLSTENIDFAVNDFFS